MLPPRQHSWHRHHRPPPPPPPPHHHWHSLPPEPPTVPQSSSSSSWLLPFHLLTIRRRSQCDDVAPCLFAYIIKFILEVLGAAGAIWGSSEVLMLRTPNNSATVWRPMAAFVGSVFFVRWCVQVWQEIKNRLRRRDGDEEEDDDEDDDDEQSTSLAQSSSQDPDALFATLTEDLVEKKAASIDDLEMIENG